MTRSDLRRGSEDSSFEHGALQIRADVLDAQFEFHRGLDGLEAHVRVSAVMC